MINDTYDCHDALVEMLEEALRVHRSGEPVPGVFAAFGGPTTISAHDAVEQTLTSVATTLRNIAAKRRRDADEAIK